MEWKPDLLTVGRYICGKDENPQWEAGWIGNGEINIMVGKVSVAPPQ